MSNPIDEIDKNFCQFLYPPFSSILATFILKYQNYIRFISFSLFFYLYFDNTNTEICISPHLAKKLCAVHIKPTNSNFTIFSQKNATNAGLLAVRIMGIRDAYLLARWVFSLFPIWK